MANLVWQMEFQRYGSAWVDCESVSFRNVTGSACLGAERTSESAVPPIPGVLRYKVLTVNGSNITLSCSVTNVADAHHPLIDDSIATTAGTVMTHNEVEITLAGTINVNDEFEVAYGYAWDTESLSWTPAMAFGILVPGESSTSVFVKITNIADRSRANVVLSWENDGPDFISARFVDGTWVDASTGQIYLQDSVGVEGYMESGGECNLELRANPSSSLDATYNMVQVQLTITSLEI